MNTIDGKTPRQGKATVSEVILDGKSVSDLDLVRSSRFFDGEWYRKSNPDVDKLGMEPAEHYLWLGWRLGREPSAHFSGNRYLTRYPDVRVAGQNPLVHYLRQGRVEGKLVEPSGGAAPVFSLAGRMGNMPVGSMPIGNMQQGVPEAEIASLKSKAEEVADTTLVSIIMPAYNRERTIGKAIRSVLSQSYKNFELHIIDDGSSDSTVSVIKEYLSDPRVHLHLSQHKGVCAARNTGLAACAGDIVAYLDTDNVWVNDYLAMMVGFMTKYGHDVAYCADEVKGDNGIHVRGRPFDWNDCLKGNFIDLNVYCHARSLLDRWGGFDESLRRMVDWDLILRQTRHAKSIGFLPFVGCSYTNGSADRNRISVKESRAFRHIVVAKAKNDPILPGYSIVQDVQLKFAIKIPAPFDKRQEWGDFHYADSLAGSLNRLGHQVRIDFHGDWDNASSFDDDVVIVIRGLTSYDPKPGQISILWMISHPDQVSLEEIKAYDLVYVASLSYANFLTNVTDAKVKPLLQATDINRFNPERKAPAETFDALFVGNSRNEYRDMVRWAIDAGVDIAVFGTRWEKFVPKELIRGENISNKELGGYYKSSNVVLNDHWRSMKDFGLISNRIFDVLASGGRVISDQVHAISQVFGDIVPQVSSADELKKAMQDLPKGEQVKTIQSNISKQVRALHSFDQRAQTIVNDVFGRLGQNSDALGAPGIVGKKRRLSVRAIVRKDREFPQASAFIRLVCPLTTDRAYGEVDFSLAPARESFVRSDVAIVQRTAFDSLERAEEFVTFCRKNGVRIFTDNDDAFALMDERHPEYELYKPRIAALDYLLSHAESNWVSTKPMSEAYAQYNPQIIPNHIDPRLWRDYRRTLKASSGPFQIVYAGTATHDQDFRLVEEALDHLARRHKFVLTIIGAVRKPPQKPWLQVLTPPQSAQSYPGFVHWFRRQGPFDIGIAPLADTPFNTAKSDLKLLDYGALGILPVVSDVPAYRDTIAKARCGFAVENSTEDWISHLSAVFEDRARLLRMAEHSQAYCYSQRSVDRMYELQRQYLFS
ncbi:glycosyltransferase involved in cell wall biosynthesis [Mesorhizobium sp. J18]|uniref:glycosyltransferase n=1 Tax=Mesorhizobium sp. J18 TaxID=935263 RepID=UPI00119C4728|nr:glycosyltransferase [Mesorhizobium sp. J18]TWG90309.1 glycosyltransferase involved in cell wall biosynthesis [Mesorhizobium sp. J18]